MRPKERERESVGGDLSITLLFYAFSYTSEHILLFILELKSLEVGSDAVDYNTLQYSA